MLGILIKKQLMEIFRGYFYDTRKNKARSKAATIGLIAIFAVLMFGLLGSMFYGMAAGLAGPLSSAGLGWLFFAMIGLIAIFIGVLGSAFTTYAGLYLAKDNDLLLSMPIPVRTIVAARAFSVYLLGLLFSGVAIIPALIAWWQTVPPTAARIIGGLVFLLLVSAIVLVLSCLLGYGVARLSIKLKNKSWITTLLALVFLGVYYAFYFKGMELLQDFIMHLDEYTGKIGAKLSFLKVFGEAGEGKPVAILLSAAAVFLLCAAVRTVLLRSFTKIATADRSGGKAVYREKAAKERGVIKALESKEFGRFTSSSNYMLNTGLTVIFLPVLGVLLLVKGGEFLPLIEPLFAQFPGLIPVVITAMICSLAAMVDIVVPSVSLEGKSLWILQSLPVDPADVLKAKMLLQLKFTLPPTLFASVCAGLVLKPSAAVWVLLILLPVIAVIFFTAFGLMLGIVRANLNWTNEVTIIKQSLMVLLYLLAGMVYGLVVAGLYFVIGRELGPAPWLAVIAAVTAVLAVLILRWLKTKGAERFARL